MDASFWHDRWEAGQIGFHEGEVNGLLAAYVDRLGLAPGARIFAPLCGKTRDIAWLLSRGYRVTGAELSEIAIVQLFEELGVDPEISTSGVLKLYSGGGVDIHVGDIFALTAEALGPVDAVFDRAALVALPEDMRVDYAHHLTAVTGGARQLLITFEYDQSVMPGPPFSIDAAEVRRHYRDRLVVQEIETRDVAGGLKGICPATETIWLLSPQT